MLNTQPIAKVVASDGRQLVVHSIFHTIQGEGPFCGRPAVFVRLSDCNLMCPLCDTEYTSVRMTMTPVEIYKVVTRFPIQSGGLVVLTGGEPFRQPVEMLLRALTSEGFAVQVETNGTLPPQDFIYERELMGEPMPGCAYIVCSPKTGKINPEVLQQACALKYVACADDIEEDDGLPRTALGHSANPRLARPPLFWRRPVYLQPADEQDEEKNRANRLAVVKSCMKFGYTIQLQTHKLLELE